MTVENQQQITDQQFLVNQDSSAETELTAEQKRDHLKQALNSFAAAGEAEREAQLASVLQVVHQLASPETLPQDPVFQADLEAAVESSLSTSFGMPNGETIIPWRGAHTVVALNFQGNILGWTTDTDDQVYELYGSNLLPFGLAKAVVRLHLELAGKSGGLDNDENYEYVRGILPPEDFDKPETLLFKGEAIVDAIAGQNEHPGVILGATGCPLKWEYKSTVAPGMRGVDPIDDVNFLAGSADEEFAEITAIHLARLNMPLESVREHREYSRLRRAH